jgi:uncharacterized protein (TIGR02284 family)
MNNNEVISILDGLIMTCRKGQEAFRNAAENIQNSEFRRLFNIFSQQRAQFISELRAEIHRLGGNGILENEVVPDLPQNTLPFRSAASKAAANRDEASIITECRREEEAAVNDYQEALKADLPLDVQYVVKRQYMDIKDAYDRIRILQRAA